MRILVHTMRINKLRRIRTWFEIACLFTEMNYFARVRGNRNSTNLEKQMLMLLFRRSSFESS